MFSKVVLTILRATGLLDEENSALLVTRFPDGEREMYNLVVEEYNKRENSYSASIKEAVDAKGKSIVGYSALWVKSKNENRIKGCM